MRSPIRPSVALTLVALALAGPLSTSARAAAPDDCPTLLPDLRCERSGRYPGFVMPMSMPYLFEDPFITTGVQLVGIWHDFPEKSVFQGGDALIGAAQVRIALTDRLALVASQDGRTGISAGNPLIDKATGYMDLIAGLKYALVDRPDDRFIVTTSLRYKTSQGSREVLQGGGEGGWLPGLAVGWGTETIHTIADIGGYFPVDGDAESSFGFYNLHLDFTATPALTPFVEINGIHYIDEGDGSQILSLRNGLRLSVSAAQAALGTGAFEAIDYGNLGSAGVDGHDYISGAAGFRYALARHVSAGVAYERPLVRRREITKQRATLSLVFEF